MKPKNTGSYCTIPGCYKPEYGKGLCDMHRTRFRRYGHFNRTKNLPWQERFWKYVKKGTKEECWPWTGCVHNGYGILMIDGTPVGAHRAAIVLHFDIPFPRSPVMVCHTCDNPKCVNPAHLYLGTPLSNMRDAKTRGRNCYGSKSPHAQIDEKTAATIKRAHGTATAKEIAEQLGVSLWIVIDIWAKRTWTHVKP